MCNSRSAWAWACLIQSGKFSLWLVHLLLQSSKHISFHCCFRFWRFWRFGVHKHFCLVYLQSFQHYVQLKVFYSQGRDGLLVCIQIITVNQSNIRKKLLEILGSRKAMPLDASPAAARMHWPPLLIYSHLYINFLISKSLNETDEQKVIGDSWIKESNAFGCLTSNGQDALTADDLLIHSIKSSWRS